MLPTVMSGCPAGSLLPSLAELKSQLTLKWEKLRKDPGKGRIVAGLNIPSQSQGKPRK